MVTWTTVRPGAHGASIGSLVAGLLCTGLIACASAPDSPTAEAEQTSASGSVLADVWVERDGNASLVTLVGLEDSVYEVYTHEDPATLVLDVMGASTTADGEPLVVYDGLVEQVSVSSFEGEGEPSTRVEVSLAENASYEVIPTSVGLALRIEAAGDGETEVAAADDPWADSGEAEASGDDPWAESTDGESEMAAAGETDESAELEPVEFVQAAPATQVSAVVAQPTESGVLVHIQADGSVENVSAFTLEDPDRLVIDLLGLGSSVPHNEIDLAREDARRIRIGAHADKVRVVIDGGSEANGFEGRRVVPAHTGLFVTIGSGEELDAALAAGLNSMPTSETEAMETEFAEETASEEMEVAEAADAGEVPEAAWDEAADGSTETAMAEPTTDAFITDDALAVVHGVHFDSQPMRDRVVVLSEGLIEYETHSPDPETYVISMIGARIPREAEGRITPQPGGPVSLVTAFQQPEVEIAEVRIVFMRAPDLEPEISRKGSLLFVDFENTGVAAAAPPAFPGAALVQSTGSTMTAPTMAMASETQGTGSPPAMPAETAGFETLDGEAVVAEIAPTDTSDGSLPQFSETGTLSGEAGLDGRGMALPASVPESVAVPASLEPPAAVEILAEGGLIDGKEYQGRRISLDFKDVEIADVLRIIAEVSDLNIVAGEEVAGQVTIRLVDVPWDQALDVILLTKGLGFVRVGNVLRIAPADILAQEEEVRLQERRNKEKLEDLVVKLHPVNYAAVADVSGLVKRLLSPRGSVQVDERTNTLIMKDIGSVIDEATALVNAIDTQTPQVMIEAKIVEAALDFSRELGSVWSVGTNEFEDGFTQTGVNRDLGGEDFKFHDRNNVVVANPITSVASGLLNLNAFILDEKINLGVQLQAAESEGDGKVISSPRVVTLDNREAEIQQGVSIPFQTFENGDAKLEFIDAVLRLLVTPHITADKSIIMKVEVERNAPDDSVQTPTGSPAIAKNEAKTETLIKDGQTLVIGGIYTVNKSERFSRVPYLHKIPLLGSMFRNREVTDQRKELLIFVTPRIVLQPDDA